MKTYVKVYLIFMVLSLNAQAQESRIKSIQLLNPLILRNEYNSLYNDLKKIYTDFAYRDTFEIEFTFDTRWNMQEFKTNKEDDLNDLKSIIEQKDWVYNNNNYALSDSMKLKYELIFITKGRIKLFRERNKVSIVSNIQKVNINMYDVRNFYFYKGIYLNSKKTIKPLNSWYFENYLKDSLKLEIANVKKHMHISNDNRTKFTVPARFFRSFSKLYLRLNDNEIVELSKKQNYVYLPKDSKIDFLAVECNSGKVIIKSIILSEDYIMDDRYEKSNYILLAEMINSWSIK